MPLSFPNVISELPLTVRSLILICLLAVTVSDASSDENTSTTWMHVLPRLKARCVKCHGPIQPKAGLNLSSAVTLALGGKNGPPVVPGHLDESLIWQRISAGEMPPDEPLSAADQRILRHWIEEGADGLPRPDDPATKHGTRHWAYRSLQRPSRPVIDRKKVVVQTAIDHFVQLRLENVGLSFSDEADRATLIRRVCFDLTGLPPTPEAVIKFKHDTAPDAFQRMVDHYLASPHYGVRWGKYWLDAGGYADSNGYFAADTDRPLAYRYRDWVVRAFNEDQAYDQFVIDQLAGDELVNYQPDVDVTSQMVDRLTATHFLRNAPDGSALSDGNVDEVRIDRYTVLEGMLEITMNSLLGVTIQCARCHDHKFEPVTQREYYSLQAIFFGAYNPDSWTVPDDRVVTIGLKADRDAHQLLGAKLDEQIQVLRDELRSAGLPYRRMVILERLKHIGADQLSSILEAWETAQQDRSDEQHQLVEDYKQELEVSDEDLVKKFPQFAEVQERIKESIERHEQSRPEPLAKIAVLVDVDSKPADHHVLVLGQHHEPGSVVQPGVPAVFSRDSNRYRIEADDLTNSSGRRLAFARWVSSPDNPLFARVMVNRVWMHHFGEGLVTTPANLGLSGAAPSHPDLLDYLAVELIRSEWSIKALHRLILGSAVYRQRSSPHEAGLASDPDNRLLWRYPLHRLSAEAVRDSILSVSGQLNNQMYGPYVPTERKSDGLVVVKEDHPGALRRSIFLQQRRTQMPSMLKLFDAPEMVTSCPQRDTSTVPLQSLAMLNSQFTRSCARQMAHRLREEAGANDREQIERAVLLAAGRAPWPVELRASLEFLSKQRKAYAQEADADHRVWTDFCQMLLAGSSALYIE